MREMTKIFGLVVLMVSWSVQGQVTIPSYTPQGHESSARAEGTSSIAIEREELKSEVGITSSVCNKGEYGGKDLSWNFLYAVSSGRIFHDEDVSINEKSELEGNFYLDYYISACFTPAIKTIKRGDKIFIRVENIYFDNKKGYGGIKNIDKKYELCLRNEGLLKTDGSLDMDKIEKKGLISSVSLPYRNAENKGSPLKLDKNRTYDIYFASNKTSDYGTPKATSVTDRPSNENWKCANFHQLSIEKPFHKGKLDLLAKDIIDICEGNNFEKKIRGVLRLRNSSSVGNFEKLSSVVDNILIQALEKEQEEIFDGEGKLADLESKMRELLVESRKRDKRIDNEALGAEAKKLGKNYKKLLVRLKDKIYKPGKKMIEKLHEDYENARSDQERERIREKLNGFSQIMEKLSEKRKSASCKRGPCAFYRQFYIHEGQEQFRREASIFEDLRLSSAFWSRASIDGRGSMSPSTIRRKVKVGKRKFARRTDSWGRDASILEGDTSPIRSQRKRIGKSLEKAQKLYRKGPYEGLSWWCKSANTEACIKKRRKREQMFQKRMQSLGRKIQRGQSRLMRYEGLAEQYQLRREYEREQDGWNEGEYFDDEVDYYSEQFNFPGFDSGNSYQQGPYAPYRYNMGYPPMEPYLNRPPMGGAQGW